MLNDDSRVPVRHASADEDDGPILESCDGCGRMMELGSLYEGDAPLLGTFPDSSACMSSAPANDGKRMVMVCSYTRMDEVAERFRQRPFVEEELWAGKIFRAVEAAGRALDPREPERRTGLAPWQILAAATGPTARTGAGTARADHAAWAVGAAGAGRVDRTVLRRVRRRVIRLMSEG
ncbi:hypothetical protein ABT187_03880 [Streptomyces sp. NPDC001817]|uniref:hypothetical protein n=1 Tax=Streptomyces sp. NPDC001817 TaxID=3154398 RepID=UPI00331F1340